MPGAVWRDWRRRMGLPRRPRGNLPRLRDEKATARLQKVKGIGDWSSQFILFRGLGRVETLQPINIRPLMKTMEEVYGPEGKALDEINSTYGRWSGYWSLYLRASTMVG